MSLLAAVLFAAPAFAEELEIVVPREVDQLVLTCDKEVFTMDLADGTRKPDGSYAFEFPIRPGRNCDVHVRARVGNIEQLGAWNCGPTGCVQTSSGHVEAMNVPDGQIKVVIASDIPNTDLELTCPGGYRERSPITEHLGSFTDVPREECTLLFKGGPPMKFSPITWGGWECHIVSNTPVCSKR